MTSTQERVEDHLAATQIYAIDWLAARIKQLETENHPILYKEAMDACRLLLAPYIGKQEGPVE